MQLQINLRRIDTALDANDRERFLLLCAIRRELQRQSKE